MNINRLSKPQYTVTNDSIEQPGGASSGQDGVISEQSGRGHTQGVSNPTGDSPDGGISTRLARYNNNPAYNPNMIIQRGEVTETPGGERGACLAARLARYNHNSDYVSSNIVYRGDIAVNENGAIIDIVESNTEGTTSQTQGNTQATTTAAHGAGVDATIFKQVNAQRVEGPTPYKGLRTQFSFGDAHLLEDFFVQRNPRGHYRGTLTTTTSTLEKSFSLGSDTSSLGLRRLFDTGSLASLESFNSGASSFGLKRLFSTGSVSSGEESNSGYERDTTLKRQARKRLKWIKVKSFFTGKGPKKEEKREGTRHAIMNFFRKYFVRKSADPVPQDVRKELQRVSELQKNGYSVNGKIRLGMDSLLRHPVLSLAPEDIPVLFPLPSCKWNTLLPSEACVKTSNPVFYQELINLKGSVYINIFQRLTDEIHRKGDAIVEDSELAVVHSALAFLQSIPSTHIQANFEVYYNFYHAACQLIFGKIEASLQDMRNGNVDVVKLFERPILGEDSDVSELFVSSSLFLAEVQGQGATAEEQGGASGEQEAVEKGAEGAQAEVKEPIHIKTGKMHRLVQGLLKPKEATPAEEVARILRLQERGCVIKGMRMPSMQSFVEHPFRLSPRSLPALHIIFPRVVKNTEFRDLVLRNESEEVYQGIFRQQAGLYSQLYRGLTKEVRVLRALSPDSPSSTTMLLLQVALEFMAVIPQEYLGQSWNIYNNFFEAVYPLFHENPNVKVRDIKEKLDACKPDYSAGALGEGAASEDLFPAGPSSQIPSQTTEGAGTSVAQPQHPVSPSQSGGTPTVTPGRDLGARPKERKQESKREGKEEARVGVSGERLVATVEHPGKILPETLFPHVSGEREDVASAYEVIDVQRTGHPHHCQVTIDELATGTISIDTTDYHYDWIIFPSLSLTKPFLSYTPEDKAFYASIWLAGAPQYMKILARYRSELVSKSIGDGLNNPARLGKTLAFIEACLEHMSEESERQLVGSFVQAARRFEHVLNPEAKERISRLLAHPGQGEAPQQEPKRKGPKKVPVAPSFLKKIFVKQPQGRYTSPKEEAGKCNPKVSFIYGPGERSDVASASEVITMLHQGNSEYCNVSIDDLSSGRVKLDNNEGNYDDIVFPNSAPEHPFLSYTPDDVAFYSRIWSTYTTDYIDLFSNYIFEIKTKIEQGGIENPKRLHKAVMFLHSCWPYIKMGPVKEVLRRFVDLADQCNIPSETKVLTQGILNFRGGTSPSEDKKAGSPTPKQSLFSKIFQGRHVEKTNEEGPGKIKKNMLYVYGKNERKTVVSVQELLDIQRTGDDTYCNNTLPALALGTIKFDSQDGNFDAVIFPGRNNTNPYLSFQHSDKTLYQTIWRTGAQNYLDILRLYTQELEKSDELNNPNRLMMALKFLENCSDYIEVGEEGLLAKFFVESAQKFENSLGRRGKNRIRRLLKVFSKYKVLSEEGASGKEAQPSSSSQGLFKKLFAGGRTKIFKTEQEQSGKVNKELSYIYLPGENAAKACLAEILHLQEDESRRLAEGDGKYDTTEDCNEDVLFPGRSSTKPYLSYTLDDVVFYKKLWEVRGDDYIEVMGNYGKELERRDPLSDPNNPARLEKILEFLFNCWPHIIDPVQRGAVAHFVQRASRFTDCMSQDTQGIIEHILSSQ